MRRIIDKIMSLKWVFPFLLALCVSAVYLIHAGNDFVYDDKVVIIRQQPIESFSQFAEIFRTGHYLDFAYYRPVVRSTLLLQKTIHGHDPLPFHIFNALLIGFAFWIGFKLLSLEKLRIKPALAFTGALIFALHPVSSAVVYPIASGRETLLPAVFILCAVYFYLKESRKGFIPAILFYTLALFSKEQSIVLPALFVLADVLGLSGLNPSKDFKVWALKYAPVLIITWLYLCIRAYLFQGNELSFNQPILGPVLAVLYTLQSIVVPFIQDIYEPPLNVWFSLPRLAAAVIAASAIAALAVRKWKEFWKLLLFWGFFFLIFLLPTANIIQQEAPYSERYVFLSMFAFLAALFMVVSEFYTEKSGKQIIGICSFLIIGLASITVYRGSFYRDDITFFTHWMKTNPDNPSSYDGLGCALIDKGQYTEGIGYLKKSSEMSPDSPALYYNIGLCYLENLTNYEESVKYFDKCIQTDKNHVAPQAYFLKGEGLRNLRRYPEALQSYLYYLTLFPDLPETVEAIAICYDEMGRPSDAIPYYRRLLALDPDSKTARERLASLGRAH